MTVRSANKNSGNQTEKEAQREGQANHPTDNWGNILSGTVRDLHSASWIQNLVVGAIYSIIALGLSILVQSRRFAIFSVALGVTIIIWIIAFAIDRRIRHGEQAPPAPTPTPATVDKQDKAQDSLDRIEARMAAYQKSHAPDLSKEFPLGYSLFTMKGRDEVIPFHAAAPGDTTVDWSQCRVQVTDDRINMVLPDIVFAKRRSSMQNVSFSFPNQAGFSKLLFKFLKRTSDEPDVGLVIEIVESTPDTRMVVLGLKPL